VHRWEPRHDRQPDRDSALVNGALVNAAIAEREQGRARLNAATVTVSLASVAAAGVLAFGLPGPASSSTTTKPATSGGQQNQGGTGIQNQGDPGNSGFNPPAYTPVPAGGGGAPVSTSGGTHSGSGF
jgi:hypothetical protein